MLQKAFGFVELEFEVTVPKMMKYIVLDQMVRLYYIKLERIKKFQKVR